MKSLNIYINEAWGNMKQHALKSDIEAWCDDIGIYDYTINSQGEIDVDGYVNLFNKDFKELPYKFGKVNGTFDLSGCKNLISLKNCPNYVRGSFYCHKCKNLNSLEGCPKEVGGGFYCNSCKQKFTKEEVQSLCNVEKTRIYV